MKMKEIINIKEKKENKIILLIIKFIFDLLIIK